MLKAFYMSGCDKNATTEVEIMWTNQHGTGPKTDDRVESQVILQYMCQDFPEERFPDGKLPDNARADNEFEYHTIRNGISHGQQPFNKNLRIHRERKDFGLHEPAYYYRAYVERQRNKGESI